MPHGGEANGLATVPGRGGDLDSGDPGPRQQPLTSWRPDNSTTPTSSCSFTRPGITDYRALEVGTNYHARLDSTCDAGITGQRRSGRHSSAQHTEYHASVQNALPCYLAHPEACNTLDGSDDKRKFEPCKPRQRCDVVEIEDCGLHGGNVSASALLSQAPSQAKHWGPTLIPPSPGSTEDTSKHRPSIFTYFLDDRLIHCQPLGQSDAGILRPLWTPSSPSPSAAYCTQ